MLIDPPLRKAGRFPLTLAVAVAAIGVSLAWWGGMDIEPILLDPVRVLRRPWGLVLGVFPHVNMVHLGFNLLWMWTLGARLEHVFGRSRAMAVLLVIAVVSSAAEYVVSSGGVGLSGVVYGMFGLMYAMRAHQPVFAQVTGPQNVQLFGAWFVVCILLTLTDVMRVGNVAHGSGAVIGWLIGRAIVAQDGRRKGRIAGVAAIAGLTLMAATAARPWLGLVMGNVDMMAGAGLEAMSRKDYAGAVVELERAAQGPSVGPETLVNLGICYQHLNRDSEALPLYRRAIEMEPRFRESLVDAMVSILNKQGHDAASSGLLVEAAGALREATELNPKSEYAWRLLGTVYEQQGDRGRAHECYIHAAIASPDDSDLAEAVRRTAPADGRP